MTTVGPELTSFIDPSLTWKKVSKGRNTSRRSRRSVSKNMKMVHEHEKRSPKRLNNLQCLESEQSNAMTRGRHFPRNMEHIPIKKRRLFFRSPSPPLQCPNRQEESEDLVGDHCTADQLTCSDVTSESPVMGVNFSEGLKSRNVDCDGNTEEKGVKLLNDDTRGLGEDFSGIAILAAAACSDRLDYSTDDAVKSPSEMGGLLSREQNEPFVSASHLKVNITNIQSPDLLGIDIKRAEGGCMVNLLDSIQVATVSNDADDVCMSPIKEIQKAEQNESAASTSLNKENVECLGLPLSTRSDDLHKNKAFADSPIKVADKTSENSGANRDCRFHWDLNTVMDEWGNPLDDTDTNFALGTPLVEVAPMNTMDSQNVENVEGSEAKGFVITNVDVEGLEAKNLEATVSDDRVTCQAEVSVEPESKVLPDNAGSYSVSTTASRMRHCLDLSSGFVTSILKQNLSLSDVQNHVLESLVCTTDSGNQPEVVNEDATIDHSLSLGLNSTKTLAMEENIVAGSENLNKVAEETQIVKSEEHEISFLLAPVSGEAFAVGKDDCKRIEDSGRRNVLDENDKIVANVMCQSTSNPALGSKCEAATLDASETGEVSCRVNNLNCPPKQNSLVDSEVKYEEYQPSSSENLMVELKSFRVSHCSSKVVDGVATSMSMGDDQAINTVSAREIEENPAVTDASVNDPLNDHGYEALVTKMLDPCVAVDPCSKPTSGHVDKALDVGHGSHVSNEDSSQVTENAGIVTELEGGYDSHLEDGELRESHCWEDNEGEDGDTEHVDYDSDNRDGFVFYEAANDSVQLSGEVLVGESEKQSCRSDNFSSADEQPNINKSVEENCSLRFQGCFSTVDAVEAVCTKRDLALKACSAAINSEKGEMENKDCRSSIEADSIGKEFDCDPPRNARGASASGRDLQFSDRCADSMRRSRSSNFDCIHHTDGPDGSLNRSQQPSMRMGRFGGRSWNPELKSTIANSASEDDGDRIVRASGDTSPFRGRRPRIINTSRSGYHIVRRGSPGERGSDYGMGMIKAREFSPDNNQRSRFGRFNGINRGFREGYRRPGVYEGPKSGGGGPMLNRFAKRDRSFSPVGDRFHRKSRSRSRTRSPDFRSEARMGRGRLPYQQANHAGEHTRERKSPVRVFNPNQRFDAIGSPGRMRSDDCMRTTMRPMRFHDTTTSGRGHDFEESDDFRRKPLLMRNNRRSRSRSRSCSPDFRSDTRMGSMRVHYQPPGDHIRDRRSPPVRVFRSDQRYEGAGSPPVRLRSDECLRPIMRPLRFPDTAQPGRAHELNNSSNNNNNNGDDFRRKPRNIFERIHPGRHYDVEGGNVRRFQYDNEEGAPPVTQNFRRNENYGRAGERRPVDFRGPREERGNGRYNNNNNNTSDRMFYSAPKQFGMRDYAEDGIPRRPRP